MVLYPISGCSEAGPFGHPCPDGHGLHVDESEFVCEIVDEELRPTPLGERGELLLTPLRRTGFPVLRYRTGDVTRLDPAPCRCGRTTVRMARVVGRTDDRLVGVAGRSAGWLGAAAILAGQADDMVIAWPAQLSIGSGCRILW